MYFVHSFWYHILFCRAHQAIPPFPYHHPGMAGMAGMAGLFYQDALSGQHYFIVLSICNQMLTSEIRE